MKRKKKLNPSKKICVLILLFGIITAMVLTGRVLIQRLERIPDFDLYKTATDQIPEADYSTENWYLTLVNSENRIPNGYEIELTELFNGEKVDSRIYPQLQSMFDDMRAEGIYPIVGEGYRTVAEQQELMNEKVNEFILQGYSQKKAEKLAAQWVAVPGTSEHELGLAVDINADKAQSTNEEVYNWLYENAHKYGFILRYPMFKSDITGIDYEPWHYRYVGTTDAERIYENNLCLEEYLEIYRKE